MQRRLATAVATRARAGPPPPSARDLLRRHREAGVATASRTMHGHSDRGGKPDAKLGDGATVVLFDRCLDEKRTENATDCDKFAIFDKYQAVSRRHDTRHIHTSLWNILTSALHNTEHVQEVAEHLSFRTAMNTLWRRCPVSAIILPYSSLIGTLTGSRMTSLPMTLSNL